MTRVQQMTTLFASQASFPSQLSALASWLKIHPALPNPACPAGCNTDIIMFRTSVLYVTKRVAVS